MNVASLEAFGGDRNILKVWAESGHGNLLPVQVAAVRRGKVLDGGSAVVFSPTSSGKTFVGEMAAVRVARQNKRVIYLAPQKALAEEKYREFQARYAPFGLRVVISTRDRREHDRAIHRGQFHVAVVVFEKFQALLVASPALLRNVGLVIIDELQMIGDKARGAGLEILLTKMLLADERPQIIALSAVLGNADCLAGWLGATLIEELRRPVELRKGVLHAGKFRYVEHNSGDEGVEDLNHSPAPAADAGLLVSEVCRLVAKGEQCLVFCKSRSESVETAGAIAKALKAMPASKTLEELGHLEDSRGKDVLTSLLGRRVAYHNADLDWDQREVIERGFRKGEIAVICATSTLAMGLNFPSRNVIIDPQRWDRDRYGQWTTVPISQAEYENMSGRAGRLGLEKEFGRAILLADSPFDAATYFDTFVKGNLGDVRPTLDDAPLSQHVLNLVASGLCRTKGEIRDVLLSSYTGVLYWKGGSREEAFTAKLEQGLAHCIEGELILCGKRGLEVTPVGKLAAAKGVSVDTAIDLAAFAKENADWAVAVDPLEILWRLTGTECGRDVYFQLAKLELKDDGYPRLLGEAVARLPQAAGKRMRRALAEFRPAEYEDVKRAKKTLLMHEWINGNATRRVETRYHCFSGSIYALATQYAWLGETMTGVAKALDWPDDAVERVMVLSQQLVHGVQEQGLPLASARVRGLARGRIAELVSQGMTDFKRIAALPFEQLRKLVTRPVAEQLKKRAARELQEAEASLPAQEDKFDEVTGQPPDEPEYTDWPEQYPPSDDTGAAYRSSAEIVIDGRARERRHLVIVGGKEAWLQANSFEAALKMAVAAKKTDLGWVNALALGDHDTYHQIIRRLKMDLGVDGVEPEQLIENNKGKQYRFSVPPQNITIREDMVLRHCPEAKRILDEMKPASESTT